MTPLVIDNFLPDADYARLRAYVSEQPMKYGSKSNSRTDPHGHWKWKPVHDSNKNLADLTKTLPRELRDIWDNMTVPAGGPHAVIRCYANGYTYGTDGYFHTDSDRQDEHTIIIYICEKWEPDWAGETVWYAQAGTQNCALPWPNRAVILPSSIMHCARAVSRKCSELRTTFMFKTRPKRSKEFERLSEFLVQHGALNHKHSVGTLHDHLVRVFALLEAKDSATYQIPLSVRYGGGLHSIYGTNVYQSQLMKPDAINRSTVSSYFGQQAEALAYMFSVLDRPATLEEPDMHDSRLKLRYDQHVEISPQTVRNLQLIECANLLDQGSLSKWPNLSRIWGA